MKVTLASAQPQCRAWASVAKEGIQKPASLYGKQDHAAQFKKLTYIPPMSNHCKKACEIYNDIAALAAPSSNCNLVGINVYA